MDLGMPTLIENDGLRENAELCVSLGLNFVELNMNLPEYLPRMLENNAELRSLASSSPIYFTVHLDENLNVADFNEAVSDAYFDTVKRAIDVCRNIGAPVLNMHMNRGVHFTLPDRKVYLFEKYRDEYVRSYNKFREVCEKEIGGADISICIENTDGWRDFEKEAMEHLLESDVFSLTFDIGHSHSIGDADESFILRHADKLRHFHIHDARGRSNHLALGSGDIDLKSRLCLARECGCRCVVETKTAEALKASAEWLRAHGYMQPLAQ